MKPLQEQRDKGENENLKFFESLSENITEGISETTLKGSQFKQPLFEFSGACTGCGETPYIKLVTQLFGDRMIIANATGCSSIFSGTFATTPFCKNHEGKGPAWANSLFEDNAEYGFGMRLAVDSNREQLKSNINKIFETGTTVELERALRKMLEVWNKVDEEAKFARDEVLKCLSQATSEVYGESEPILKKIDELKDYLIDKSVWIVGGDGWAYDIGFGGLDHVIAQGKNVNILILDTEVYSNTGGQASKATPRGVTAKFAISGKKTAKKNLGYMMMSYGNVYVASVSMGGNRAQVVKAMVEAEKFNGPSIIIAYSPCIAHGFNMQNAEGHQMKAVSSGYWPLYRYDPENGLQWESPEPSIDFRDYILEETRYKSLQIQFPDLAENLFDLAKLDAENRHKIYKNLMKKD
jgi:pyruvate-ferredoxin/flavodoxin oxidoreductase